MSGVLIFPLQTQAMVISTQHLVSPEPAKPKASTSTAASDQNPQPGKQTGFGHTLYSLDLGARVGK